MKTASFAIAAIAVLAAWIGSDVTAQARGALAIGRCGGWGGAWNYSTADEANNTAMSECNGRNVRECKVVATLDENCASFAYDDSESCGPWGWATRPTKEAADSTALNECRNAGGRNCKVRGSFCDASRKPNLDTSQPRSSRDIDWDQCRDVNNRAEADRNMAACDRILNDRTETSQNRATAYGNRCGLWNTKGDNNRAIADCDQAIQLNARLVFAYNNRGIAWSGKGDYARAIADYTEAIRLDPNYAQGYSNRCDDRRSKGDLDLAIEDCNQAIRLKPDYTNAYYNRGLTWRAKGDNDRAIADYDETIRLDPKYANAYVGRGLAWRAKNNLERAIADYSEAIRLQPNDAIAYNNRGYAWRVKGDNDRAIADYTDAIRRDPKYATAYANRANAWHAKGDDDRAIADYGEAIRIEPNSSVRYRSRGYVYFSLGDFNNAASDLLRANDLADNSYTMLWRYLARTRLGQDGTAELGTNAARLKTKDWPYAVIDFYLGKRTMDDVRTAASSTDERCEVEFYIGEWHLLRGNSADARTALKAAADTCPQTFIEYDGAVGELKRLK